MLYKSKDPQKKDKNLEEFPPLPDTEIVPPGRIQTHDELERLEVDDRDVEIMREWNEENKL